MTSMNYKTHNFKPVPPADKTPFHYGWNTLHKIWQDIKPRRRTRCQLVEYIGSFAAMRVVADLHCAEMCWCQTGESATIVNSAMIKQAAIICSDAMRFTDLYLYPGDLALTWK